jgi:hypothetical protein
MKQAFTFVSLEYWYSIYVRSDNDLEYMKYLGYINTRDLYPGFISRTFEVYAKELLDGKAVAVYRGMSLKLGHLGLECN